MCLLCGEGEKMAKSVLGYSPLTERIYLGRTAKNNPNMWAGEKRDMTNNFIQVMLQKFEPNTIHNISVNGENKYRILVVGMDDKVTVNGKAV